MDDYWTDVARPRRRNWWQLDEAPELQPDYPPIGLEGFRLDPPPTVGFNVPSLPTDPLGDFARSWTAPVEQGPLDEQMSPSRAAPAEDSHKSGHAFPSAGAAIGAFAGSAPIAVPEAATAMPRVAATARLIASLAPLGPAALLAAPMIALPTNSGGDAIELGDGRRLFWNRDGLSFDLEKGDGGLLKSGILETWKKTADNVPEELLNNPKLDLESIRRTFGPDGVGLAVRTIHESELGQNTSSSTEKPSSDYYFTRRLLNRFPDLIERDTDHWAKEDFQPSAVEREHEEACHQIQKQRGEEPPDGKYSGPDAVDTLFGWVPPVLGGPAAQSRPENKSHEAGIMGETEMALRLHNLGLGYLIPYYGNPPGVNGPDGIAVNEQHRGMMLLESKYSTNPRAVGGAEAFMSPPNPLLVDQRMRRAVELNRIPESIADDAFTDFKNGNYTSCIGGTGNAHNGYAITYRNGDAVSVKRFR